MKLVINKCYGGFGLSRLAYERLAELGGRLPLDPDSDNRADPLLIQVVEELGTRANGSCAELAIVEIPDGIEWEINEYDGSESVHEKHRSWD